MRKILLILLLSPAITFSQVLNEPFNYGASGGNLTAVTSNWTAISAGGTNPQQYIASGLSFTGYQGSSGGVTFTTSGEDDSRTITTPITSGTVYAAALVSISSAQATGDYFFNLLNTTTTFAGRVFVKLASAGVINFGLGKASTSPTYSSVNFALNTTYLIVVKYTFNTGSSTDDVNSLWVLPAGSSFATEYAASYENATAGPLIPDMGSGAADLAQVAGVLIRQGTASSAPAGTIDEIRLATTWEDAVNTTVWNGTTWSFGAPGTTTNARVSGDLSLAGNLTTRECEVDAGKTVTPNSNTITTSQFLTLRSTSSGNGMIGQGSASGGYITGSVLVERYIPAKRAWRFLTAPYTSATTQTINLAWQEGRTFPTSPAANELTGFGTHITGGTEANGFDQGSTGNPSIKTFDGTVWSSTAPPTATTKLTAYPGYMVFVRGDRKTDLTQGTSATPTTTVLRSLGTLKTGTQSVTVGASGYTAVGNPYASTVDFASMTKTNVQNVLYLWDPKRASYGAWVAFDGSLGYTPNSTGGSYNSANSLIQSGQGFLVQSTGTAGTLGIGETNKSSVNQDVFRTTGSMPNEFIKVNLNYVNADNSTTLADGLLVVYDNNYNNNVTSEDVAKMNNFEENLSVLNAGQKLSIDKRAPIAANDVLVFDLSSTTLRNYQFELTTQNLNHPNLSGYLVDNYLNIKTPIDLNGVSKINFSVTTDPSSASANRFSVVFTKPQIGDPAIVIYPNPVQNGQVRVLMNNMPKGMYTLKVVNTAGQTVATKQINHGEGNSIETITVNTIKGNYLLEVIKPDNSKFTNKILFN